MIEGERETKHLQGTVPEHPGVDGGVRCSLMFDFRNPGRRRSFESIYENVFEQIRYADDEGFGGVWLAEHHFCDDGYSPSPLVIAGSVAASTKRVVIGTNLIVLPLHHPLRIAEDVATLGILAPGRFILGVGSGYRVREFGALGVELRHRPSIVEEGIKIIRLAWTGEPFSFSGKRFQIDDVQVQPVPAVPVPILAGGYAPAAVRRVATLADGYLSTNRDGCQLYADCLEELGHACTAGRIAMVAWSIIAEDPERAWAEVGPLAVDQCNSYVQHGAFGDPETFGYYKDPADLLARGKYKLWDAATAIGELNSLLEEFPQIEEFQFWARVPGEDFESSNERLEYMAMHIVPAFRSHSSSAPAS